MRKLLFVVSRPPYQSSHDFELLEAAMVGGVFDLAVSVLFRDDGVWALLPGQDASALGRKTLSKTLEALATYEINDVYVCAESLIRRGLTLDGLTIQTKPLSFAEQADLYVAQEAVIGAQS